MGLFESNPWLLIPITVVTMEAWNALKSFTRDVRAQRRSARRALLASRLTSKRNRP